jgi:hypothetical protein
LACANINRTCETEHKLCTQYGLGGNSHGQIWRRGIEERPLDDASAQARDAAEWIGPEGPEPLAGDRHRAERGAPQGRQGAVAVRVVLAPAIVGQPRAEDVGT